MSHPAVFLDRDGTLIEERSYLADPEGVTLLPGVAAGLEALQHHGYRLIVVTNQSGIARGLIRPEGYELVRRRLDALLADHGVVLDGVYVCPHHPSITGPCDCRKPGLALYRQAAAEHDLDFARSVFIGDKPSDVERARWAAVRSSSGRGTGARAKARSMHLRRSQTTSPTRSSWCWAPALPQVRREIPRAVWGKALGRNGFAVDARGGAR
jgi:D-glycero-D-manno-heptose 1,7-bisphosphate phosphatase